jgi:hypothetical protein
LHDSLELGVAAMLAAAAGHSFPAPQPGES